MSYPRQPDDFTVILVRPRNPLNIGAAARAMANFGFTRLTVVAPYEPSWRQARSAVDCEQILQDARQVASLEEAISGAALVLGTGSLTYRKPEQPVVQLPELAPIVRQQLAAGGSIALLFGPEKHGLTREDLSWCHRLIEIPTSTLQPSMNLGQAVAVCLYELAMRARRPESSGIQFFPPPVHTAPHPAEEQNTAGDLRRLAELIEQTMQTAHYSPDSMREANRHDLRLLLLRLGLTRHDLRRALGLFRRILHALGRSGGNRLAQP